MAGYIGELPVPQGTIHKQEFSVTNASGQSTFPTIGFTPGFCDVHLNGIKLLRNVDFDDSNSSDILLTTAAALNDVLEVTIFDTFTTSSATFTGTTTFADGGNIITATAGTDNVRLGQGAGASIVSGGNQNVAIGTSALAANTTGDFNTAVGTTALDANTTASYNTAVGYNALTANSTGTGNVAVGVALGANTTANDNTAMGNGALGSNTTGASNTAIGRNALVSNTTAPRNTAVGFESLTANTTGDNNTGLGERSGAANTTGHNNTFLGQDAGEANTTGASNVAVGSDALQANTTASENTAVGYQAGFTNTTSSGLTYVGRAAGYSTTGSHNTFIGEGAGYYVSSGVKNTILGRFNGNQDNFDIRTSNDQIAISNGDGNVRIFCNTEGYTKHKPVNVTTYATGGAYHEFSHNNNDTSAIIFYQAHASFSNSVQFTQAQRTASSSYSMAEWRSGAGSDVEFYLRGDGNAYADGSWNGGGADYAEYFEWADGNSDSQDRTGYTVVLDNEKVRLSTSDDSAANIIGAVSVNPSVVGDSDIDQWKHKYKRDEFGGFVWETYTVTEWKEEEVLHTYETDKIPDDVTVPDDATVSTKDANGNTFERKVLNTDYNPDAAYVSRANRKEWSTIGMMGKLRIRKGQQTGDRWIKMRDVSDSVEEWLVR